MDWKSFGVVGFGLGPCLQGQTRIAKLKSAYNSLIVGRSPMHMESHKWSIWVSLRRYRATDCEKLTSFKYYGASVSACTFH